MFTLFQVLMLIDGFFTWTLVGQGALFAIAGRSRHDNAIYRLFGLLTTPIISLTKRAIPIKMSELAAGVVTLLWLIALRLAIYVIFYYNGWIPNVTSAVSH